MKSLRTIKNKTVTMGSYRRPRGDTRIFSPIVYLVHGSNHPITTRTALLGFHEILERSTFTDGFLHFADSWYARGRLNQHIRVTTKYVYPHRANVQTRRNNRSTISLFTIFFIISSTKNPHTHTTVHICHMKPSPQRYITSNKVPTNALPPSHFSAQRTQQTPDSHPKLHGPFYLEH